MIGDIWVYLLYLVIFTVISFNVGAVIMIIYKRLKNITRESSYYVNQNMFNVVVAEYMYKLKDLEKTIAELRVKTDTMEMRISQQFVSQTPIITNTAATTYQSKVSQNQSQLEHSPLSPTAVNMQSSTPAFDTDADTYNNTMDHILKLLIERPRTSREIQHDIRRTREHTSRLMKKLHEANLVIRESNSKPFKYSISDGGRIQLKEHQKTSAVAVAVAEDDGIQAHVGVPEFQLQTTV
jgi:DNA-binding MarR family transcriptional regulator